MTRSQQPNHKNGRIVSISEKSLELVKGGAEEELKQHVDNPGQTPMKDGLS